MEEEKISWTEKKTNESVWLEIGAEEYKTLQQTAIKKKLGFFGHVMRSDGLEKGMMLACGEGRTGMWRGKEEKRMTMDGRDT